MIIIFNAISFPHCHPHHFHHQRWQFWGIAYAVFETRYTLQESDYSLMATPHWLLLKFLYLLDKLSSVQNPSWLIVNCGDWKFHELGIPLSLSRTKWNGINQVTSQVGMKLVSYITCYALEIPMISAASRWRRRLQLQTYLGAAQAQEDLALEQPSLQLQRWGQLGKRWHDLSGGWGGGQGALGMDFPY